MHGDAVVGTHFFGAARLPGIYHTKLHEEVFIIHQTHIAYFIKRNWITYLFIHE
ncbi:MAG: hypothetical protein H6Q14_2977 [Bacteroidetes bacterium]|nr:hypothetical protein [Bacteroidota bacterium]